MAESVAVATGPVLEPLHDGVALRFARRALTIPAVGLGLVTVIATLPVLLALAVTVDVVRRSRSASTVRLLAFGVCFFITESVGIAMLFGVFLATLFRESRREALTVKVQRVYTAMHWWFVQAVYHVHGEVEGGELAASGPMIVMVRHVSLVDVLVPGVFIANPHRIALRYALKRELLWLPCLDIAGHWIRNHFVARGGVDTAGDVGGVRALKTGLGERSGVLLFPEGTRFNAKAREKALARKTPGADRLKHLLPMRPGGALAVLDAGAPCDVVFVGHHGLEGLVKLEDIWLGNLLGRTLRVKLWRESAASIPAGAEARLAWLQQHWERLDAWLEGQRA